jgi:predicted O-methyltransferase YrrM
MSIENIFYCNYQDIYNHEYAKDAIVSNRLPGFVEDYTILHCLLKKFMPKRVIEIGTEKGEGTKTIKNALGDNSEVFTLDLPMDLGTQYGAEYPYQDVGKLCNLPFTQLFGDSTKFDFSKHYPLDCFFIDANHEYRNVVIETKEAVKANASLIIYHDADMPEVFKAIIDQLGGADYNVFRVQNTRMCFAIKKNMSYNEKIPGINSIKVFENTQKNVDPLLNIEFSSEKEVATVVIVYQDSLPWLHVVLNCLKHFKDKIPKRYIFVENVPQRDNSTEYVKEFLESVNYQYNSKIITKECHSYDGRGHSDGLEFAFKEITSEYTMFMDADCPPICDGWMEYLISLNQDIIGPIPESGINNTLRLCHPCFFIFKTYLAKPPYWTKQKSLLQRESYFGEWGRDILDVVIPQKVYGKREGHFDVCRPFSYVMCLDPEVRSKVIQNIRQETPVARQPYFLIADDKKKLAVHIRSMSRQWAREGGEFRYQILQELSEFEFCRDQYPLKFKHSYPEVKKITDPSFTYNTQQ